MLTSELPGLIVDQTEDLATSATAAFSADRTYRYALTRTWHPDRPVAVFVMLNPSTADAFKADPTIRRCERFARAWTGGGILVLNAFALRATDPHALPRHPDPVGPDNDKVIAWHFSVDAAPVGPVVVAWGNHGTLHGRGERVLELLYGRGVRPLCFGLTGQGQPRHPLYLPADAATREV